mmetsp:Transcript_14219/g.29103  ORF Transcript_14219/g.29103 Transcript_14219/m.29103 type:complete len:91 (-) Transcript_14219:631-903(-)
MAEVGRYTGPERETSLIAVIGTLCTAREFSRPHPKELAFDTLSSTLKKQYTGFSLPRGLPFKNARYLHFIWNSIHMWDSTYIPTIATWAK